MTDTTSKDAPLSAGVRVLRSPTEHTDVPVYRGMALVTLPFRKIAKIEFGKKQGSRREAKIFFHDQDPEAFTVDDKVLFVGELSIGTFQIQVRDMESIEFIRPSPDEDQSP